MLNCGTKFQQIVGFDGGAVVVNVGKGKGEIVWVIRNRMKLQKTDERNVGLFRACAPILAKFYILVKSYEHVN